MVTYPNDNKGTNDMATIVNRVVFNMRRKIGEYEHEDLTCDLAPDGEETTANELMAEARRVCIENSTEYKKKLTRENKPTPGTSPGTPSFPAPSLS